MPNKVILKKISKKVALLLSLAVILTLSACVESEPTKEIASNNSSSAASEETVTFTTGETAVFENLKITANETKETSGDSTGFFSAESGKIFVGINFTIENISDETQNVSSILLFEAYADDTKCDYSVSAACAFSDGTLDGEIAPGKKLTGWYAVEIPSDWSSLELHVAPSWLSNSKAVFVFNK